MAPAPPTSPAYLAKAQGWDLGGSSDLLLPRCPGGKGKCRGESRVAGAWWANRFHVWIVTCLHAAAAAMTGSHTGGVRSWPVAGPGTHWLPTHRRGPGLPCGLGTAPAAPASGVGGAGGAGALKQVRVLALYAPTPPGPPLTSRLCLAPLCSAQSRGVRPRWSRRRRSPPACSRCSITGLRPEKAPACTGVRPSRQRLQNDEERNGSGKGQKRVERWQDGSTEG